MGLIDASHDFEMNPELENLSPRKLRLIIVNEYDMKIIAISMILKKMITWPLDTCSFSILVKEGQLRRW